MKTIDTDIAIIGGGSSGLVAGIAASRYGCNNITILENCPESARKYYLPVTEDATYQILRFLQETMTVIPGCCHM